MILNTKKLAEVEIGQPVIAVGAYFGRLSKVETKPNTAGTGSNLVVQVRVLDKVLNRFDGQGEFENKGFTLTRNISLVPTTNYDPDKAIKELAVAIGHPKNLDLEVSDLPNKIVKVRITRREAREEEKNGVKTGRIFPESNDIAGFSPVKDDETIPS